MEGSAINRGLPLTDFLMNKASLLRLPVSGTFELTPMCNFSCKMCYVRKTKQDVAAHNRKMMRAEDWLDIANRAREHGMLYLLLTGGEPFIWPDFWNLYNELIKMGFLISINSNGSLIDDEVIRKLKENPPLRINITLYGASDETYYQLCGVKDVFSKVDQAITKLTDAGIQVKLNCSLTPSNAHDLEAMVQYAKDRKLIIQVSTYMFPPMRRDPAMIGSNERFTPHDAAFYHLRRYQLMNSDERYESFLTQLCNDEVVALGLDESCIDPIDGKIRCRAGNASFWVTWDGWLTPCGMMNDPKVDLYNKEFYVAWKRLVELSDQIMLTGVCHKCVNYQVCHACAAMALAETGRTEGIPIYLCQMMSEMKKIALQELRIRRTEPV